MKQILKQEFNVNMYFCNKIKLFMTYISLLCPCVKKLLRIILTTDVKIRAKSWLLYCRKNTVKVEENKKKDIQFTSKIDYSAVFQLKQISSFLWSEFLEKWIKTERNLMRGFRTKAFSTQSPSLLSYFVFKWWW